MPFRIRAPCVPPFPGGGFASVFPACSPFQGVAGRPACHAPCGPVAAPAPGCPAPCRRRSLAGGMHPPAHVQPETKKEPGKTIRVPCIWPGGGVSRRTFPNLCAGGDEAKDTHGIPVTNPAHPCLRAQPRLENLYAPRVALHGNPSAGAAPETPLRTAAETAGPSARHRCGGGTLASQSYAFQ